MTEAKMVCIYCGAEFIIKDLELFIEKLSEASETMTRKLGITDEHEIRKMLKMNNIIDARKQLEEHGHLRMGCIPCHLKKSWEAFL